MASGIPSAEAVGNPSAVFAGTAASAAAAVVAEELRSGEALD